jgi:hypothetical protein
MKHIETIRVKHIESICYIMAIQAHGSVWSAGVR